MGKVYVDETGIAPTGVGKWLTAGLLMLAIGLVALWFCVRMPSFRDTEAGLLYADAAFSGLRIGLGVGGVLGIASAAIFTVKAWRIFRCRRDCDPGKADREF